MPSSWSRTSNASCRGGALAAARPRRSRWSQITSALIGIGLVLSAVFGPMAFFGGSTGVIYRQFSVTIIAAMLLSVVVALILTPVLCAALLKPVSKGHGAGARPAFVPVRAVFPVVRSRVLSGPRSTYLAVAAHVISNKAPVPGHLMSCSWSPWGSLSADADRVPPGRRPGHPVGPGDAADRFHPGADPGGDGPGAAAFHGGRERGRGHCFTMAGRSFSGTGQNMGLRLSSSRTGSCGAHSHLKVDALLKRALSKFSGLRNALVFAFPPPASWSSGSPAASTSSFRTGPGWGIAP